MLKRRYAIIWFLLSIITLNISVLFLGKKLKLYKEDGWYTKWYYWVLGTVFGIIPAIVMLYILVIQINVKVCIKFNVAGKEIYGLPYVWIGSLIIPIIGWTLFLVLLIYIYIMYIFSLLIGKGKKYILHKEV